ncbi:MAG: YciI family protein [Opitutus sp.]
MKYICLGYIDSNAFASILENEQHAMMDRCFAYDDQLRANGHFTGGEALQPPSTSMTLQYANGQVVVTDGPLTETREQLRGIMILKARDLNHAVDLISRHPEQSSALGKFVPLPTSARWCGKARRATRSGYREPDSDRYAIQKINPTT